MWVAWHIGGAAGTLDQWLDHDDFTRSIITKELLARIDANNAQFQKK